jgi:type IV pilus biogenesis protein CpaD/CtpE
MSDQNSGSEKYALGMVALLVGAVVAGVIGWSITKLNQPAKAPVHPMAAAQAARHGPQKIMLEADPKILPSSAQDALTNMTRMARGNQGVKIQITPFQLADTQGDQNKAAALQRAETVRHGLEANGVARNQMYVSRPTVLPPNAKAKDAWRVDLSLQ